MQQTTLTTATIQPTRRVTKASTAITVSPARPVARKGSTTSITNINTARSAAQSKVTGLRIMDKKNFSPVRDPLGNSPGGSDISGKWARFLFTLILVFWY